jgi:23S rRNA (cytosine1962-C5)-methyltransferase
MPPKTYPILQLKPGRDASLRSRHHAVMASAIGSVGEAEAGGIVEVRAASGDFLAFAFYNPKATIAARAFAFQPGDPLLQLKAAIERAVEGREALRADRGTDCWRLVNAEGDAVPGLIVDQFGPVLSVQLTTLGMDRQREWVLDLLMALLKPEAIVEKSAGTAREKEGLPNVEGWVRGKPQGTVSVKERGLRFLVDLEGGQKTGFFLDQREMRTLVRNLAGGRTVLDICSYVGGFSVNALAGGALAAVAVDYDKAAVARAQEHARVNGFSLSQFETSATDAFDYLRRVPKGAKFDFIVLDPPAFAKRSQDLEPAKKAYGDLNRLAMQILPPGGLLLTCSCSYQMTPDLFQQTVFQAARQAGRGATILSRHRQALDHPVNLFHPEGDYLKSLLLRID